MIRVGDYKLLVYPQAARLRLYNLAEDPQELDDLSGNPQHWSRINALYKDLKAIQSEMDDSLDLDTFFPSMAKG